MRILTIVFCLVCFYASAHAQDTVVNKKDDILKNAYGGSLTTKNKANPLCIIDGKQLPDSLYKKLFRIINSKDVLNVDVLKAKAAIAKYGTAGANGAVIIKMKPGTYNAQNVMIPESDTVYTSAEKRLILKNGINRAYIKIDDAVYNGRLESVDTADIKNISVLKPEDAVAIFGDRAANGAILIKTKHVKMIALVKDTLPSAITPATLKQGASLVLVDGEIYKGDINQIDPQNIIDITILQNTPNKDPKESDTPNGETIITTRPYAILLYQKKFSTISKKYKDYIDLKHSDTKLQYVLNNNLLNIKRKSAVTDLYQLSVNDIESIEFKKDSHFTTDATVIINTKE